jgi:hypothetical protein
MRNVRLTRLSYAREALKAGNPKFHPGKDPLELETMLTTIQPTTRQELDQMTEMLELTYPAATRTPQQTQALELWKFQVASNTTQDQVKFQFLRRFYFWLLGRGSEEDTKKTLWGRANAAIHNSEVAAYIDAFVDKRAQYATKLNMLSLNIPETVNGYYLYFKYVVNGALRRVNRPDGTSFWDMSNEDYLEDFDLFRQVLDKTDIMGRNDIDHGPDAYADLIAPSVNRKDSGRTRHMRAFEGVEQFPITHENLRGGDEYNKAKKVDALEPKAAIENAAKGIAEQLQLQKEKERMPTVAQDDVDPQEVDEPPKRAPDVVTAEVFAAPAVNPPPVPLGKEPSTDKGKEEEDPETLAKLDKPVITPLEKIKEHIAVARAAAADARNASNETAELFRAVSSNAPEGSTVTENSAMEDVSVPSASEEVTIKGETEEEKTAAKKAKKKAKKLKKLQKKLAKHSVSTLPISPIAKK